MIVARKYEILVAREYSVDSVRINYSKEHAVSLSSSQRREIRRIVRELKQAGKVVARRRPLYKLLSFRASSDELTLFVGRTYYREYLGTNRTHPEWHTEFGDECMANLLGVSVCLETSDGMIVLEDRSPRVATYSGFYHVKPSGHPPAPHDLTSAIMQQAKGELALEKQELALLACSGLIRALPERKPEVTFIGQTPVSSHELQERVSRRQWETERLFFLECDPDILRKFLVSQQARTTPPGHASLILAGRSKYGHRWFRDTVSVLGN